MKSRTFNEFKFSSVILFVNRFLLFIDNYISFIREDDRAGAQDLPANSATDDRRHVFRRAIARRLMADNDSTDQTGTLRIKETLKGVPGQTVECLIPYADQTHLAQWQQDKTELLVCLVKSDRYRAKESKAPMPVAWSVRRGEGDGTGLIPLDGQLPRRAATIDFSCLTKADEILKFAAENIQANVGTKVAREADGAMPSVGLNIPFDSSLDRELHSHSSNGLRVPLNEQTEGKGRQWIKSARADVRGNGVAVLGHFKSEENIAALKTLLIDPDAQASLEGTKTIRKYPLRAAALAALHAWGVEAKAVVSETVLSEDHVLPSLQSFKFIGPETTKEQIIAKLGEPSSSVACGFYDIYTYRLKDGTDICMGVDDKSKIMFVTHGKETLYGHTMFEKK